MSIASKAVFLSHASQDAEAARKICDALRAAGIEVWFDQSELSAFASRLRRDKRGGDAWDSRFARSFGLFQEETHRLRGAEVASVSLRSAGVLGFEFGGEFE